MAAACRACSSRAALGSIKTALQPAQRRATCGRRRAAVQPAASLDGATITAVTQQAVAFVAVLGGEAAFTGLSTDPSVPGRPTVPETTIGVSGTLGAVAMLQQQGIVGTAGCVVGALVAAAMMSTMIRRTQKTPYNPADWPGQKAWPATMSLISFFMLAAFFQALTAALK